MPCRKIESERIEIHSDEFLAYISASISLESYSPCGPSKYIVIVVAGRYSFCVVTFKTDLARRLARFVFNVRPDCSCSCSFSCCCLWVSQTSDGFTRSPQELQFALPWASLARQSVQGQARQDALPFRRCFASPSELCGRKCARRSFHLFLLGQVCGL